MNELEKIQRSTKRLGIFLGLLTLLVLIAIVLLIRSPKVDTVTNNYAGKNGLNGKDATVDYDLIYSYINDRIASIPTPKDGQNGMNGTSCTTVPTDTGASIVCTDGTSSTVTNGTNGTNGADGQYGRTPEFACQNGDFVTRYQGDDTWNVLQKDSKACKK